MSERANDFERRVRASMDAEEARPPSRWHRRWIALLAAVCVVQWLGLLYVAADRGVPAVPTVVLLNAAANTALLAVFVVRLRRNGSAWRRRDLPGNRR